MAVLQIQRICICALKKERKQILELIQRLGVIEINDVLPEDSVFQKSDISASESLFQKSTATATEALHILGQYVPEKKGKLSMLEGRNQVDVEVYDKFHQKYETVSHIIRRILKSAKRIAEHKAEILKLQTQLEILSPWKAMDIPLNFSGTKYTSGFIGTMPNVWTLESLYETFSDFLPLDINIISTSRDQTYVFIVCGKENTEVLSEALRGNGFSTPSISVDTIPTKKMEEIEHEIAKLNAEIQEAEEKIKSSGDSRHDIQFLLDYDTMRMEKYDVISRLVQSNRVFVINGYIAETEARKVETTLSENFDVAVEIDTPSNKEDVPILLKNNGFSTPLEGTVEAFSLPGKGEIDPTMVMSLFYYLLFGLMLSDAAYGIIIFGVCAFGLLKFKGRIEDSMRNTLKMFMFCGISTMFWGILFGSYLGDIVDVVSSTFFGKTVSIPPIWFFPVNEPMRMLVFSMFLGLIHLFSGLAMKSYQCIRAKDYKAFLYDVMLWVFLLLGCVLSLLTMDVFVEMLGMGFKLPAVVGSVSGIIALLAAIGIILTNGRESKNPFKRFLKGLYALYGITGYLSDVLSYSRLLALGLATGVICTVINKMASMTATGPIGVVIFTVIVLAGHTLNIAINALGAYVHTNRLQYVEFFGKFYEGGGRKFQPFSVKTKYFKFKEKMKNE